MITIKVIAALVILFSLNFAASAQDKAAFRPDASARDGRAGAGRALPRVAPASNPAFARRTASTPVLCRSDQRLREAPTLHDQCLCGRLARRQGRAGHAHARKGVARSGSQEDLDHAHRREWRHGQHVVVLQGRLTTSVVVQQAPLV